TAPTLFLDLEPEEVALTDPERLDLAPARCTSHAPGNADRDGPVGHVGVVELQDGSAATSVLSALTKFRTTCNDSHAFSKTRPPPVIAKAATLFSVEMPI